MYLKGIRKYSLPKKPAWESSFQIKTRQAASVKHNNISNESGRTFQLKSQDFCNLFVRPLRLTKGIDYLNTIGV